MQDASCLSGGITIHTNTHTPMEGPFGVQYLAPRTHQNAGGARNRTTNITISRRPALPALLRHSCKGPIRQRMFCSLQAHFTAFFKGLWWTQKRGTWCVSLPPRQRWMCPEGLCFVGRCPSVPFLWGKYIRNTLKAILQIWRIHLDEIVVVKVTVAY